MHQVLPLSLALQFQHIRRCYPTFRVQVRRSELVATGDLTPTPQSRTYRVKLFFAPWCYPKVYVLRPNLALLVGGAHLPHVYRTDNELCLFLPGNGEWDHGMFLADTIIPWSAEWLLWYELWQATGEWYGGGLHPDLNNSGLSRSVRRRLSKRRRNGL